MRACAVGAKFPSRRKQQLADKTKKHTQLGRPTPPQESALEPNRTGRQVLNARTQCSPRFSMKLGRRHRGKSRKFKTPSSDYFRFFVILQKKKATTSIPPCGVTSPRATTAQRVTPNSEASANKKASKSHRDERREGENGAHFVIFIYFFFCKKTVPLPPPKESK